MMRSKVTILFTFVFGICTHAYSQQPADVVEAIQKLGGTVRPNSMKHTEWEVEFHLRGRNLTDDGLKLVAKLKDVVSLNLRDTQITGAGLVHLKSLTSLQRLHLERTNVDDAGIFHLSGLVKLEYLNLYKTNITDKSLAHLKRLKSLRRLYVWQTGVSDKAATQLRKTLPRLKIVLGLDLANLPEKAPPISRVKPTALKWITQKGEKPPRSRVGDNVVIHFENRLRKTVKIYWISYSGQRRQYATLMPGKTHRQNTYSNATWLITDDNGRILGYFVTGKSAESLAVIQAQK